MFFVMMNFIFNCEEKILINNFEFYIFLFILYLIYSIFLLHLVYFSSKKYTMLLKQFDYLLTQAITRDDKY